VLFESPYPNGADGCLSNCSREKRHGHESRNCKPIHDRYDACLENFPPLNHIRYVWTEIQNEARHQKRTVFEISSLMAMSAMADVHHKARWLSASARLAAGKTGSVVADVLLDHYRGTLKQMHDVGYARYAVRQFRPYLYAAASQFSPSRRSLTERMLKK